MTPEQKKEIAQKILNALGGQKFADWYSSGNFDAFISGAENAVSESQILEEIERIFRL